MWILGPLSPFLDLFPHLRLLDLRGVRPWRHAPEPQTYLYSRQSLLERIPWMSSTSGLCDVIYGSEEESDQECDSPALVEAGAGGALLHSAAQGSSPSLLGHQSAASYDHRAENSGGGLQANESVHGTTSQGRRPNASEIKMRAFLAEAKLLLEGRPKWQPPSVSSASASGWCAADAWGREESQIPDWRRPSAGGVRHGTGPWLLLDTEDPEQK